MDVTRILREMTTPVVGCTEPAAIALAASLATAAASGEIPPWVRGCGEPAPATKATPPARVEMVAVRTVRSLYKNALAVGIPGASEGGIHLSAALGPFLDPSAGLNLLKAVDREMLDRARALVRDAETIVLEVRADDQDVLFVEARVIAVFDGERHVGEAVIRGRHDSVELLRRDGRALLRRGADATGPEQVHDALCELAQLSMPELIELAESIDSDGRAHVLRGIEMNRAASEVGIRDRLGLGIGAALSDLVTRGVLTDDVVVRAKRVTAGAADARMSGAEVDVMSSSGSGNQGIMASLPIAAVAATRGADEDRMIRAVALSHLVTAATTVHTGVLSALCGCVVKAGMGAAAGLAYLVGAPVDAAVTNMAGNITGEICDGAKVGCAVKICTATGAAVESALLAGSGVRIPASNGILADAPRRIFENIGELARAMQSADRTIVQIMERKEIARRQASAT
jgi:L-cysteine desulfidase